MHSRLLALIAVTLSLPACFAEPLEGPKPTQGRVVTTVFPLNVNGKVDVLFLIDNSNGMLALQREFQNRLSAFFKPLQDLADRGTYTDLHVGVVTSDYGAGVTGAPGCMPVGPIGGGDQGKLVGVGAAAAPSCRAPVGTNYIEYKFSNIQPVSNLPGNQNLVETLVCMTSVGERGCGFEHSLESVYAALHNDIQENRGFLRDDAKLVVFFLTDEDDASASPDSDIFDKQKVAQYGYMDSYSRQTRFGVMCGDPVVFPPYASSNGPLESCRPAPNPDGISGPGKLFDVSRYRDFFALPRVQGGVKESPLDVILFAIDGPETPFEVILSNPGTPAGQPYVVCPELREDLNPPCVPVLQHSCVNRLNPSLDADPAVRLNDVIRSVRQNQISSACDDDFGSALESGARRVAATLGANCVTATFPRDASGNRVINCQVQELTRLPDGTERRTPLPTCDDPVSPTRVPCWSIEDKASCQGVSPEGLGLTIRRASTNGVPNEPPPNTSALVECAAAAAK